MSEKLSMGDLEGLVGKLRVMSCKPREVTSNRQAETMNLIDSQLGISTHRWAVGDEYYTLNMLTY